MCAMIITSVNWLIFNFALHNITIARFACFSLSLLLLLLFVFFCFVLLLNRTARHLQQIAIYCCFMCFTIVVADAVLTFFYYIVFFELCFTSTAMKRCGNHKFFLLFFIYLESNCKMNEERRINFNIRKRQWNVSKNIGWISKEAPSSNIRFKLI